MLQLAQISPAKSCVGQPQSTSVFIYFTRTFSTLTIYTMFVYCLSLTHNFLCIGASGCNIMQSLIVLGAVLYATFCFGAINSVMLGNSCKGPLTPSNPSTFWVQLITHNGTAPFNPNPL